MKERALNAGLIVPANNTTMEPELIEWLPPGSTCRRLGIPRGKGMLTPGDLPAYLANTVELAATFAGDSIDLVVYGCTAAGFMAGPRRDAEVAAEIAERTAKPVVTTAGAMTASLEHIGARRVTLVTPYLDAVNERLKSFIESAGIAVDALASFRAQTVDELAAITPSQIRELARATMAPESDALFIACSQLPTRAILGELEREIARPAWSSIRATAWAARSAAGAAGSKSGCETEVTK